MFEIFVSTIENSSPIFLTVLITLILRHRKILTTQTKDALAPVIFKFMIPFLIFKILYGVEVGFDNLVVFLFLAGYLAISWVILIIISKLFSWPKFTTGAILISFSSFSVGSFAYPFIQLNFSDEVFKNVVIFDLFLFVALMILGPVIGSIYDSSKDFSLKDTLGKIFRDVILQTVIITVIINTLNFDVPEFVLKTADFISKGFIFSVLVFLTLTLKLPNLKKSKLILTAYLSRNFILMVGFLIFFSFFDLSLVVKQALIITTLFIPFSSFTLNYTNEYSLDSEAIAQLSLFSLVTAMVLYPLLLVAVQNIK